MIHCCSCNKSIKVNGRKLRVCKECHKPVCYGCQIDGICKECGIVLYQNTIVGDYFEEKYKEKTELNPISQQQTRNLQHQTKTLGGY